MIHLVATAIVLLTATSAARAAVLTAVCEGPRSWSVQHGASGTVAGDGPASHPDVVEGMTLTFIADDRRPDVLTVIRRHGASGVPAPAERATILHMTELLLTALVTSPTEIRVYALYPALGFGAFARHAVDPHGPRAAVSEVSYAGCRFRVAQELN